MSISKCNCGKLYDTDFQFEVDKHGNCICNECFDHPVEKPIMAYYFGMIDATCRIYESVEAIEKIKSIIEEYNQKSNLYIKYISKGII
jgi:hypothetical protein